MSAIDLNQIFSSGSGAAGLWRDDAAHAEAADDTAFQQQWPSFTCHTSYDSCDPPRATTACTLTSQAHSFQAHSHEELGPLGDTIAQLLSEEGCCSSEGSSEKADSPTPEFMPTLDWADVREDIRAPPIAAVVSPNEAVGALSPRADADDSVTSASPTGSSDGDEAELDDAARGRRRYRRSPKNNFHHVASAPRNEEAAADLPSTNATRLYVYDFDLHQQRAIIDAEFARKREDHNAMMAGRQQLCPQHMHIAAKILCNEAHRRHIHSVPFPAETKKDENCDAVPQQHTNTSPRYTSSFVGFGYGAPAHAPSLLATDAADSDRQCINAAWRNVAECVEESLFLPGAVQARLSCMGIFRHQIKVNDLLGFDDHEEERTAIRVRQLQIIDTLRRQAMRGRDPYFLERPFDFAGAAAHGTAFSAFSDDEDEYGAPYSPTAFIPMGDF